jgi:hypothetical protein
LKRIICATTESVLNLPNRNAYLLLLKKLSLFIIGGGKLGRKQEKALSPLLLQLGVFTLTAETARLGVAVGEAGQSTIFRLSVAPLVTSIVLRLRIKRRFTIYATDTSRATATF